LKISISEINLVSSHLQEQFAEELYPTVGRGVGTSISYLGSSVAGFAIQYLIYSSTVFKALPLVIMGSLTLLSGLATLFLPDTTGLALPDTLVKAEAQGSVGFGSFLSNLSGKRCKMTSQGDGNNNNSTGNGEGSSSSSDGRLC